MLGTEQWAIGPTIVALKQTEDGITYGALWNYLVSVAGDDDRADVNSTFIQPFLAKALPGGRTATINLESSYDFEGERLERAGQPDVLEGHEDRGPDGQLRGRRALLPRVTARRAGMGRAVRRHAAVSEVGGS